MKKSEIVKELQKQIERSGDEYILSIKTVGEQATETRNMLSKTRRDKNGNRATMSFKEFSEWVKEQKNEQ